MCAAKYHAVMVTDLRTAIFPPATGRAPDLIPCYHSVLRGSRLFPQATASSLQGDAAGRRDPEAPLRFLAVRGWFLERGLEAGKPRY
jgi:hypothetical protein